MHGVCAVPCRFPRSARLGLLVVAATLSGCGGRTYEGRLEESRKYYEFIEKQNVNLAPTWEGSGMRLRVPAQFVLLPPPKVEKDKAGKIVKREPDTRADVIPGGLPGLVAGWKADFNINSEDRKSAPGYLFLSSNYDLWLADKGAEEAPKLHAALVQQICSGLRVPRPADDKWKIDRYPAAESYNEQKSFRVADLDPRPEIGGLKYDVRMYLHINGDMQAALVLMIPEGVSPSAGGGAHPQSVPLTQRMALALETFSLAGAKPMRGKTGPATAAPAPF